MSKSIAWVRKKPGLLADIPDWPLPPRWCLLKVIATVTSVDTGTMLNVTFAGVSAVGAISSVIAAVWSRNSGEKAAIAAAELTAIERARRQTELTPRFRITLTEGQNGVDDLGLVDVELVGPAGLDYLDEVTIKILDETGREHWGRGLPPDVSQEEADLFVWGPWEFNVGATAQVSNNRTSIPRPYSRVDGKNWDHLTLKRTHRGRWMKLDPDAWRRERSGPLRLSILCSRAPYYHWFLLCNVLPGSNDV